MAKKTMRCFNQTIALFHLNHRIVSVYHSYSFLYPLPQLEFLKKIKLVNIYRFNNIYILYNRVHFSRHFV